MNKFKVKNSLPEPPFLLRLFVLLIPLITAGCGKTPAELQTRSHQEAVIKDYVENVLNDNVDEALKNVYFREEDISSGYYDELKEVLTEGFHIKGYRIKSIEKINEMIYLAKIVFEVNQDLDLSATSPEAEFNPYLCVIDGKLLMVSYKPHIPSDLYTDINDIPDNYEDMEKIVWD